MTLCWWHCAGKEFGSQAWSMTFETSRSRGFSKTRQWDFVAEFVDKALLTTFLLLTHRRSVVPCVSSSSEVGRFGLSFSTQRVEWIDWSAARELPSRSHSWRTDFSSEIAPWHNSHQSTTSSFSRIHPENFSVNKLLLPLLGPAAYFRLVEFLQFSSGQSFSSVKDYCCYLLLSFGPSILETYISTLVKKLGHLVRWFMTLLSKCIG